MPFGGTLHLLCSRAACVVSLSWIFSFQLQLGGALHLDCLRTACVVLLSRSLGFFVEPFVRSRFEALFLDGATVSGSTGLATPKRRH